MSNLLRIIGVGSPFNDDTLGLQAIALLRQEKHLSYAALSLEFLTLDRPGSGLIAYLDNADAVVLIDAMQSGEDDATVRRLHPDELLQQAGVPSSHNFGVAEALALANVLGALPRTLLLYGIEMGEQADPSVWYPALLALLQQDIHVLSEHTASH